MYDGEWLRSPLGWRALRCLNLKVICFSRTLHQTIQRYGITSFHAQYFPEPSEQVVNYGKPRVFFWQRINEINWPLVKQLLAGNEVEQVVLRDDPDPTHIFVEPEPNEVGIEIVRNLTVAAGTPQEDYLRLLSSCNVFIAPRLREGIGLSFLEAMARGMCVVGADLPTMNEYIFNGENGLLFDPERATSVDLTAFAECGRRARARVADGWQQWQASLPAMLQFIAEPTTRQRSYGSKILLLLWDAARHVRLRIEKVFPKLFAPTTVAVKR